MHEVLCLEGCYETVNMINKVTRKVGLNARDRPRLKRMYFTGKQRQHAKVNDHPILLLTIGSSGIIR